MQTQRVRKLRALPTRVGLRETQPHPITDLRQRQLNGIAFALSKHQGDRVLPERGDPVKHVVPDTLSRCVYTAEQLDAGPQEHALRRAHLSFLGACADEARSDAFGEEGFVELPVQDHAAPVANAQIVPGWTFEPNEGASSLQHLGKRLREALATRD